MKAQRKKDLREMSIEKLNSIKSDLTIQLITARHKSKNFGLSPPTGSRTKLVSNLKKEVAIINTFINEKNENK